MSAAQNEDPKYKITGIFLKLDLFPKASCIYPYQPINRCKSCKVYYDISKKYYKKVRPSTQFCPGMEIPALSFFVVVNSAAWQVSKCNFEPWDSSSELPAIRLLRALKVEQNFCLAHTKKACKRAGYASSCRRYEKEPAALKADLWYSATQVLSR